jgi:tetratricopeptide (TPR) repeat protein
VNTALDAGDVTGIDGLIHTAMHHYELLGLRDSLYVTSFCLSRLDLALGRHSAAVERLEELRKIDLKQADLRWQIPYVLAKGYAGKGDYIAALARYKEAISVLRACGDAARVEILAREMADVGVQQSRRCSNRQRV